MNHANFAQTTLAAAITDTGGTTITVTSEASFPAVQFIISIDTEAMLVTTVDTVTWTVTRGYEGSTAATHLNGAAIYHDLSAAEADAIATKLSLTGGTLTGDLIMDNADVTLVKLLTLHGEIDDGNSGAADTIDWNTGAAHKSTLTGNVTLAFTGLGATVIPTMTSNSAPSGVVSDYSANGDAWEAFDGDTVGAASGLYVNYWVKYAFPDGTTKVPIAYRLKIVIGSGYATGWKFQGSNNNVNWVDLDVKTGQTVLQDETLHDFQITNSTAYRYFRWLQTTNSGSSCRLINFDVVDSGIINPTAPCFLTLKLVQDATGGRTVTWPTTVKGTPNLNAAASSTSIVLLYWDGTNYYVVNPAGTLASLGLDADIATLALPANTTITAAGAAILDDANAAAQLATLGTAAYSEGTWTPVLNSFTIVGSAPAVSGVYAKIGKMTFVTCSIFAGAGGNVSVEAVSNVSNITGLPGGEIVEGTFLLATKTGYQYTGVLEFNTFFFVSPTTAQANTIVISTVYITQ